jgi:RNA polymerase sigma-70 factor, ECF subfamily
MSMAAQAWTDAQDDELVRRFVETRDAGCFAELFARHRKRIYCSCRAFFEDASTAEDATQETFLRAYQNLDRFHDGNFSAWLTRIARNVCIDQWRKQRPELSEESKLEMLADRGNVDEKADWSIAAERVRKEMDLLSPEQRRCLELIIEGYSYDETASHTGLSVKAVKSHIQNGRRMLWLRVQGIVSQLR